MKRVACGIVALTLGVSVAIAAGAPPRPAPVAGPGTRVESRASADPLPADRGSGDRRHGDDGGTPVPEPGTLVLASMGLIALGAAVRRRRS